MEATKILHKKNMLAPKLRFKGFEDSWKTLKFPELVIKSNQGVNTTTEKVEYSNDGNIVIRSNNISENIIDLNDVKFVDKNTFDRIKDPCKPKSGDILYCNIGSALGSAAIYNLDLEVTINWNVFRIQSNPKIVSNLFFTQTLNRTRKTMRRFATESTMPFISSKVFNRIQFNIPSLPEQQKIASFLSAVDEKIQQLNRKKQLLEQYKKGVMQLLFSGKGRKDAMHGVFTDKHGKPYPKWEEKKLGEVVIEYRLGGNYINTGEITEFPLIKMGNLGRGDINLNKVEYIPLDSQIDNKDKISYGDLFFNTRNTLDLVGKVAIWRNELPVAYYNSNLMYLKFENNFFMNYLLNSYYSLKGLKRFATGTTSVAAIYTKDLLKLELIIPCLEEQKKIADFLSSIDAKIEGVTNQITQTQTFKKGLLQQMFV